MSMLDKLPTQRISAALRFLAAEERLSQVKLAKKVGMSQSALNRRLSDESGLSVSELDDLARALGYTVSVTFEPIDANSTRAA